MPIFKDKGNKTITWGRVLHFGWGFAAVVAGRLLSKRKGMAIAGVAITTAGFGWEVSNRFTKGHHQFGDGRDYLSFPAGALTAAALIEGIDKLRGTYKEEET